jgi:hypothetical protein
MWLLFCTAVVLTLTDCVHCYACFLCLHCLCYCRNLSGGEKSCATLSLLLAMQGFNESPFLVSDEFDVSTQCMHILHNSATTAIPTLTANSDCDARPHCVSALLRKSLLVTVLTY